VPRMLAIGDPRESNTFGHGLAVDAAAITRQDGYVGMTARPVFRRPPLAICHERDRLTGVQSQTIKP
jgi:hypothetical protein